MSFNKKFILQVREGTLPPIPVKGAVYYISYENDPSLYYINHKGEQFMIGGKTVIINNGSGSTMFDFSTLGPTTATVGGITAGTNFPDPISAYDLWKTALWPYQNPDFNSFYINFQSTSLEVGQNLSGNSRNFRWTTSHSANIQPNSISVVNTDDGNTTIGSGLANDGSEILNFSNVTYTTHNSYHRFTINGINTNSATFSREYRVHWYFPVFWGNSLSGGDPGATGSIIQLTESEIEGLSGKEIQNNILNNSYDFVAVAGTYNYFCIPQSLPQPSSFTNTENNFEVPFRDPYVVSITNQYGVNININVYRSTNKLGGAITIRPNS